MIDRYVNLKSVWTVLDKISNGFNLTEDERILIYRFKDKLTDSSKFESDTNREFSRLQLLKRKDAIEAKLVERSVIHLNCKFSLVPQKDYWSVYVGTDEWLTKLDDNLARRIAYDINVAFKIKSARMSKFN
jgi:hypothetical protein